MPPRHTLPHTIPVAREESNVEVLWFLWGQFKIALCRALISSLIMLRSSAACIQLLAYSLSEIQ